MDRYCQLPAYKRHLHNERIFIQNLNFHTFQMFLINIGIIFAGLIFTRSQNHAIESSFVIFFSLRISLSNLHGLYIIVNIDAVKHAVLHISLQIGIIFAGAIFTRGFRGSAITYTWPYFSRVCATRYRWNEGEEESFLAY